MLVDWPGCCGTQSFYEILVMMCCRHWDTDLSRVCLWTLFKMIFSLILNGEILSLYSCKLSKPCSICLQEPIVELFDCCCRVRRSLHAVAFCVSQSFDPHSSHPNYIPFFSIFCLHSVQILNNRRERETSDFFHEISICLENCVRLVSFDFWKKWLSKKNWCSFAIKKRGESFS